MNRAPTPLEFRLGFLDLRDILSLERGAPTRGVDAAISAVMHDGTPARHLLGVVAAGPALGPRKGENVLKAPCEHALPLLGLHFDHTHPVDAFERGTFFVRSQKH